MSEDTRRAMSRRTALLTVGTVLGGVPATASATRPWATHQSNAAATPTATYELGADISGWQGQSPGSIEGVTNPTLELLPGETYEVIYENLDGITHDFQILDSDGNTVVDGADVSDSGDTNSVQFTASAEMTDYRCQYHPSSMVGAVATEASTATTTPTDLPTPTPSPTETPTETPTDTPTATSMDAATPTRSATETPTDTSTATDAPTNTETSIASAETTGTKLATATSTGTETTTMATPGFGIETAMAALLATIALELRGD